MSDIYYARGKIIKTVSHLVTASTPIRKRAWDAYHTLIDGGVHEGMEAEYAELDSIFGGIRYDEVEARLSETEAMRGAEIMLELYNAIAERRGRESVTSVTV